MEKICPRCAQPFVCKVDQIELCSCAKSPVDVRVRDYIKLNYENCLCPVCLQETVVFFDAFSINPNFKRKKLQNKSKCY